MLVWLLVNNCPNQFHFLLLRQSIVGSLAIFSSHLFSLYYWLYPDNVHLVSNKCSFIPGPQLQTMLEHIFTCQMLFLSTRQQCQSSVKKLTFMQKAQNWQIAHLFDIWLSSNNLLKSELDLCKVSRQCKQRWIELFLFRLKTCQTLHVLRLTQASTYHTKIQLTMILNIAICLL